MTATMSSGDEEGGGQDGGVRSEESRSGRGQ